jgi:(p)ppGpp synthase/HD superfamily hydrolase
MPGESLFVPSQTNTALFVQLHAAGHSMPDIVRVRDAYRLACLLFNGRYRKSERAFICHAVGVASAVAEFERDVDFIIAGMFHAAYDSGQFPDGRNGKRTPRHAEFLKSRLGERAERLIADAIGMTLHHGRPEQLLQSGSIPAADHDALFLALAHEIDDAADGGVLLARKYGDAPMERLHVCAKLARMIGREKLAEALDAQACQLNSLDWMGELAPEKLSGYVVVPNLSAYVRLRKAEFRAGDMRMLK